MRRTASGTAFSMLRSAGRRVACYSPFPAARCLATAGPHVAPQHLFPEPVLLVDKAKSISDSFVGLTAQQWGPSLLRLILVDKAALDLEEVLEIQTTCMVVNSSGRKVEGITLEDLVSSPAVRDTYQTHKPFVEGCPAQDITDPTFRPFVTVVDATLADQGRVKVRPADDDDDKRASFRDVNVLLSGCPLTTRVNLVSSEGAVKDALCWMWLRSQVTRGDIQARFADGAATELSPAALLSGKASQPDAKPFTFTFTNSEYVAGDLEILIQDVPLKVYVNTKDVQGRPKAPSVVVETIKRIFSNLYYLLGSLVLASVTAIILYLMFDAPKDTQVEVTPVLRVTGGIAKFRGDYALMDQTELNNKTRARLGNQLFPLPVYAKVGDGQMAIWYKACTAEYSAWVLGSRENIGKEPSVGEVFCLVKRPGN